MVRGWVSGLGGLLGFILIYSEISSFIGPDSFGILSFQPKIFRSKVVVFKSLKSNGPIVYVSMIKWPKIFRLKVVVFKSLDSGHPPNYISKTNRSKIFRSKRPKARMDERLFLDIFGYILGAVQKCPFWPLRAVNFKT